MTIKRADRVVVTTGQYKGMTGRVSTLKARGKGRGPHAVVFIQDTLRTITVAVRYLERLSSK